MLSCPTLVDDKNDFKNESFFVINLIVLVDCENGNFIIDVFLIFL